MGLNLRITSRRSSAYRWLLTPLALAMALVSGWMLWVIFQLDYWDYWMFPRLKAADAYIYPQLRYTIFDVVLVLWGLDGLIASGLLVWNVVSRRQNKWIRRAVFLYSGLLSLLILIGSAMLIARNHGY